MTKGLEPVTSDQARRCRELVDAQAGVGFVEKRRLRNVCRDPRVFKGAPDLPRFWRTYVEAVATTRSKSWDPQGRTTAVGWFADNYPPELEWDRLPTDDARTEAALHRGFLAASNELTVGSIYGSTMKPQQLAAGRRVLAGRWIKHEPALRTLAEAPQFAAVEREVAAALARDLPGLGPKQSRNVLQILGLVQYEIPLDSRVGNVLVKKIGFDASVNELIKRRYAHVLDWVQELCARADVPPTLFDAAAFTLDIPGKKQPSEAMRGCRR